MHMWVTGFQNVLHANHNTNATVESYHSNMKVVLKSSKARFIGRQIDWLIYQLTEDVLTHYWYAVQCKFYGFLPNKHVEQIVANVVLRAKMIPDHYVKLELDRLDLASVTFVNNYHEVYTVLAP